MQEVPQQVKEGNDEKAIDSSSSCAGVNTPAGHAIAMAVATAPAAEAAVATAQAAVEAARLSRPHYNAREHYAAIIIQTAFRGYLVCNLVFDVFISYD